MKPHPLNGRRYANWYVSYNKLTRVGWSNSISTLQRGLWQVVRRVAFQLIVPAGDLTDEPRTLAIFIRDILADLLARINPQRRVVIRAERKVDEAEKRAEFLVTARLQEWDEIVKLPYGIFQRLVTSRVGEKHLAAVTAAVHDTAAVMVPKLDIVTLKSFTRVNEIHHSTGEHIIIADGHAMDRFGQDSHEDQ